MIPHEYPRILFSQRIGEWPVRDFGLDFAGDMRLLPVPNRVLDDTALVLSDRTRLRACLLLGIIDS